MEVAIYGYVKNNDDCVVPVVGYKSGSGYTLFYNNDPFGIVCLDGFSNIDLEDMQGITEEMETNFKEMVASKARGMEAGFINTKDGLLVIKDIEWFEAEVQPKQLGTATVVPYDSSDVSVGGVDDCVEDYEEVMDIMSVYN